MMTCWRVFKLYRTKLPVRRRRRAARAHRDARDARPSHALERASDASSSVLVLERIAANGGERRRRSRAVADRSVRPRVGAHRERD
jgi:hypothetical protein